jgi:23S rRNA (uracil1939-C5)-methyltransferase
LFLASKGAKVFGIDISRSAIEDAAKNAKINNISSAWFIEGDVFKLREAGITKRSPLSGANIDKIDIVVVDPPRDGLGEKLVNLISEFNAKKVIYASCNPATLARDLKIFDILGYKTNMVEHIDMFPHTEHVECIILMTKCGQKDK